MCTVPFYPPCSESRVVDIPIFRWKNWGLERWCDLSKASQLANAGGRIWTRVSLTLRGCWVHCLEHREGLGLPQRKATTCLSSASISLIPSHFYFLSISQVWLNLHLMNPALSLRGCWSNKAWQGVSDDAIGCSGSPGRPWPWVWSRSCCLPGVLVHSPGSGEATWLPARSRAGPGAHHFI